jgi:GMP synthase-like glutamine amidotransferase
MRRTLPAIVHLCLGDEMLVGHMSSVVERRGKICRERSRLVIGLSKSIWTERVP